MAYVIDLSNSNLTSLSSFTFPSQVTSITLDNNFLTTITGLSTTYLTTLSLQNNKTLSLSDLSLFTSFTNLTFLYLSNCNISSLTNVPINLVGLDISHNSITDLSPLLDCTSLVELDASNNQITTIDSVLPNTLNDLNISSNLLTSLTGMPTDIMYLDVSYNSGLTSLTDISNLVETIILSGTSVTDFSDLPSSIQSIIHDELSLINVDTIPFNSTTITIQSQKASNFEMDQFDSKTLSMNFSPGGYTITNNLSNDWLTLSTIFYPGSLLYSISMFILSADTTDSTNGTSFRLQDVTNNITIFSKIILNTSTETITCNLLNNIPPDAVTIELQARRGDSLSSSTGTIYGALIY